MLYEYSMRTSLTLSKAFGAPLCAVTIIAAAVGLLADPAAAAPPTVTAPTAVAVASNRTTSLKGPLLITVADPDTAIIEVGLSWPNASALTEPLLSLTPTSGLTFLQGDGTDDEAVRFFGPTAKVNAALSAMGVRGSKDGGSFVLRLQVDDTPNTVDPPGGAHLTTHDIDVTVSDDAPSISQPPAQKIGRGVAKTIPVTVSDADSPIVWVTLSTNAGVGAVLPPNITLPSTTGLTIDSGSATKTIIVRFHGTIGNANAALAQLQLTGGTSEGTWTFNLDVADAAAPDVPNTDASGTSLMVVNLPSAPTDVVATPFNRGVRLTWSPPATAGDLPTTKYRITRFAAGVAQGSEQVDASQLSLGQFGLTNGVAHTFLVEAINADGAGSPAATSAVTPRVFLPFESAGAEVDRLYLDLLGRAPSAAEHTAATAAIEGGTKQPSAVVTEIRNTAESDTTVDSVTRLYRAYLLRIPDAGGLNFWLRKKRAGVKLDTISQAFATSNEFKTRYGALSNQAFVELIYQNLFSRTGDAAGIAFWTGQLDSAKRTRGRVMTGFSESNEYKTKQASEVDVSVLYIALLGRGPTQGQFTGGVFGLDTGTASVASISEEILSSQAYRERVT